jgi:hypothetical protein
MPCLFGDSNQERIGGLRGEWGDELEAKAEAIPRPNDGRDPRVEWSIEFKLKQVAGVQQDSRIQDHTALAQFGAPTGNNGGRESLGSHHANR